MAEKDSLRLSLSLGSGGGFGQDQNNPPPPPPPPVPPFPFNIHLIRSGVALPFMLPQNHQFPHPSSAEIRNAAEPRSYFRGIDVNRPATGIDCDDDDVIVSSPNSTVSSLSGKRSAAERELENDACDGERPSSSLEDDGGDGDGDAAARKKLRLSKEQAVLLEETFKEHNTLNPKQKLALAKQLNLRPRQVEVWFQNRRARTKLKQTEVDCEYLKRCCENLTEENRRLQKEVTELRALKLSPQFYMNMSPPTTLTMCPQCEHVTSSSSASTSTNNAGIARPPPMVAFSNQQPPPPMPMNPWAAIFSKAKQAPDGGRPRQ